MTGREGEREGGEGGRRERADQRRKPTRQGGREGSRRREEGTRETVLGRAHSPGFKYVLCTNSYAGR